MKKRFLAGLAVILVSAALLGGVAKARNDFFEYCTTRAYGYPLPWRIDRCLCDGGKTDYPALFGLANVGLVGFAGLAGFALASPRRKRR